MADRTPRLILGEIDALVGEARGMKVALEDAADTALQARQVNKGVWGLINTVEAGITGKLYDALGMLNAAYVKSGEDPAQFVGQLVLAGALVIREKPLISEMKRYKIDPMDFSIGKEPDADTTKAG